MAEYYLFSDTTDYRAPAIFSKTELIKKLRRMGSPSMWGNGYGYYIYDKNGYPMEWYGGNKLVPAYFSFDENVIQENKREFEEVWEARKRWLARRRFRRDLLQLQKGRTESLGSP